MEDNPSLLIQDVLSFATDDLSYRSIQDGVNQEDELDFSVEKTWS
jgi:intein-encoded DNA endonuclease-like protein